MSMKEKKKEQTKTAARKIHFLSPEISKIGFHDLKSIPCPFKTFCKLHYFLLLSWKNVVNGENIFEKVIVFGCYSN